MTEVERLREALEKIKELSSLAFNPTMGRFHQIGETAIAALDDQPLPVEEDDSMAELVEELEEKIEDYKHVVFTLAMIDRDAMTEHDEALLDEALTRAKELYENE